ncbi:protein DPCD [Kipferlia bialata]|uniref:Protein DPCD n=1 Tax=Kipferlia bialata TaxID=797122 RepID=A0A9K3D250_9EUKA|nr:protein DPCD [Kipferlia bialata]|eukprot:g8591.t1
MSLVPGGKKSVIVREGRQKIHSAFPDGSECVEEFDLKTQQCIVRKWRKKDMLGRESKWDYELGEPAEGEDLATGVSGMWLSKDAPVLHRLDHDEYIVLRVRNCPWPLKVYNARCEDGHVVIRTSNKKYYKKCPMPEMERAGITLDNKMLMLRHSGSTLLVFYRKPPMLLHAEQAAKRARLEHKAQGKEGDVQCPTQ